jgi:hypothetical protein
MTELKVECDCGQRYKFDVEPVNGRMPFTVNCPACGIDGTEKANALLQQNMAGSIAPSPVAPVPASISPVAEAPAAPLASAPTTAPRLRINLAAHSPSQSAAPSAIAPPPPIAPPLGAGPLRAAAADPAQPAKKPNFWMGMVGGFSGALIGAVVFFFIFKLTGIRFHRIAEIGSLGVGYLAGAGAAFLGKGEGSKELVGITAIFALAAIIGTEYFTGMTWFHAETSDLGGSLYSMQLKLAKDAVKQIPTGSDDEIRVYLVKEAVEDGDDDASNSVSATDINEFRTNELAEDQGLASGQVTEQQNDQKNGIDPAAEKKAESRAETIFAGVNFLLFLNKTNIVMIIAAVGLAYKVTANA